MTTGVNQWLLWPIAVVSLLFFLITNLPWQLDDYDQAKQAYTSFEMVKEGHWLYQHTPHERIATKPPLVAWVSAAIFFVTRSWAAAWRLPSLAAAIALAVLLFRAGKVYGPIGGLFALSSFVFNLLTPRLATLVRTDMPLALMISGVGLLIWNKLRLNEQWNGRERWMLFALLTAAMLIKGPIIYAFLLPGLIVIRLFCRRDDGNYNACGPWWPWISSLGIFLCWAICGAIFVPGFYDQVVVREFLGRFGETIHRPQPLLFYFPHLLHKFLPWSVLMIGIVVFSLRVQGWRFREAMRSISRETLWLVCWIFGGLIVMSIIPSKRVDRIFPTVPPLCLLLAAQLSHFSPNELNRQRVLRWSTAALLFSIVFTGAYSGFKIYTGYRDHRDALVKFGRAVRQLNWHGQRYEVLKCDDEALLLYLDRLHFVDRDRAIQEWNNGSLTGLVATEKQATWLMPQLSEAELAPESPGLRLNPAKTGQDEYLLIQRRVVLW